MLSGHQTSSPSGGVVLASMAAVAAVAGVLVAAAGVFALAGAIALATAAIIVVRPQLGAYLFLIANPLIVGVGRGELIPILRPNELLLVLLLAAWAARAVLLLLAGRTVRPTISSIDVAIFLLAVTSSVFPLLLRYSRGLPVSTDDFLYAIVLWKYLLLYWLFRGSVSSPSQVARCLWLSMASAAVVGIIGILQVANLLGVPELLAAYYDQPFSGSGSAGPMTARATSTLASPFSTADVMIMNLVIALACLQGRQNGRWLLIAAAALFLAGCLAAGSFSGFIGLIVALVTFAIITGRLIQLALGSVPFLGIALFAFWPVIGQRLAGFGGPTGLPPSWQGRIENLQHFFFPELFSGWYWLTGVRPAARLPAPESWRDWVYIESGYVWLLWIGGVPFVLAFLFFVWTSWRHLRRVICERGGAVGVAATASLAYLVVIVTLMLFDPHLTIRGSADLFFPLLALSAAGRWQQHSAVLPVPAGTHRIGAWSIRARHGPGAASCERPNPPMTSPTQGFYTP